MSAETQPHHDPELTAFLDAAAKVAKEEPKKPSACPFCGMELAQVTHGFWIHSTNERCLLAEKLGFVIPTSDLEAWNRRASPWRDISTCDLVGVEVLLHQVGNLCGPSIGIRLSRHGDWLLHDDSRVKLYPTHWQPIEPPEVGK